MPLSPSNLVKELEKLGTTVTKHRAGASNGRFENILLHSSQSWCEQHGCRTSVRKTLGGVSKNIPLTYGEYIGGDL